MASDTETDRAEHHYITPPEEMRRLADGVLSGKINPPEIVPGEPAREILRDNGIRYLFPLMEFQRTLYIDDFPIFSPKVARHLLGRGRGIEGELIRSEHVIVLESGARVTLEGIISMIPGISSLFDDNSRYESLIQEACRQNVEKALSRNGKKRPTVGVVRRYGQGLVDGRKKAVEITIYYYQTEGKFKG